MYCINPKDHGKYHNVSTGPRYCLTKKSAKDLIDTFLAAGCEKIEIKKLIRIHGDIFCWTGLDDDDSVYNHYCNRLDEGA